MSSWSILLEKIRERPGLYLGETSLYALWKFSHGYAVGYDDGARHAGKNDAVFGFQDNREWEFNHFVYSHYNRNFTTMCAESLILEESSSDEEAFYKYFELLDEFKQMPEYEYKHELINTSTNYNSDFKDSEVLNLEEVKAQIQKMAAEGWELANYCISSAGHTFNFSISVTYRKQK